MKTPHKPVDSPIVEEIHKYRMEISARYGHDLRRYVEHLREIEKQHADRLVDQVTVVASANKDK